jgi:hypothetical protein
MSNEHALDAKTVAEVLGPDSAADQAIQSVLENDVERHVAAKILPLLAGRANALAEARSAEKLNRLQTEFQVEARAALAKELEQIRKANEPLSTAELTSLLSQEYLTVEVQLPVRKGSVRNFTICELTQVAEIKILRIMQQVLIPRLKELVSMEWGGESNADKIKTLLEAIPETIEMLAEIVAVALNPYDEDPEITKTWVQKNIGSARQMHIVEAQLVVGRYRDFFSAVYRQLPAGQNA